MAVAAVKKPAGKSEAPEAAPAAPPKKGKGKLKLILSLVVLLCGLGGGAYWYLAHQAGPHESKSSAEKPPVFQALDNFTVNLQIEESPQFLQAGITLKVRDSEAADAIKQRMPEVRNAVLLLLSGRKASEILTVDGKRKLGANIVAAINVIFDPAAAPAAEKSKAAASPQEAATPDAQAQAADAAETGNEPAVSAETKPRAPVVGVLFTSFIIQ